MAAAAAPAISPLMTVAPWAAAPDGFALAAALDPLLELVAGVVVLTWVALVIVLVVLRPSRENTREPLHQTPESSPLAIVSRVSSRWHSEARLQPPQPCGPLSYSAPPSSSSLSSTYEAPEYARMLLISKNALSKLLGSAM